MNTTSYNYSNFSNFSNRIARKPTFAAASRPAPRVSPVLSRRELQQVILEMVG